MPGRVTQACEGKMAGTIAIRPLDQVLTLPIRSAPWKLHPAKGDTGQTERVERNLAERLSEIIDQMTTAIAYRRAFFETGQGPRLRHHPAARAFIYTHGAYRDRSEASPRRLNGEAPAEQRYDALAEPLRLPGVWVETGLAAQRRPEGDLVVDDPVALEGAASRCPGRGPDVCPGGLGHVEDGHPVDVHVGHDVLEVRADEGQQARKDQHEFGSGGSDAAQPTTGQVCHARSSLYSRQKMWTKPRCPRLVIDRPGTGGTRGLSDALRPSVPAAR